MLDVQPDPERAKSLLALTKLRIRRIKTYRNPSENVLLLESHYEIIKELATALLFLQGRKTYSHKELMHHLLVSKEVKPAEYELLDALREHRNRIVYEGASLDPDYLIRNGDKIKAVTNKIRSRIESILAQAGAKTNVAHPPH